MVFTNLTWDTSSAVNVTVDSNGYTLTGTATSNWDSKIKSTTTLDTGDILKIEWLGTGTSNRSTHGLGIDPFGTESTDPEYGIFYYYSPDEVNIVESSNNVANFTNTNSPWYIHIEATQIKYYNGSILKHTSSRDSGTLYAHSVFLTTGSANITYETSSSGGGSGGGEEEESTSLAGDGSLIELSLIHI